MSCNYQSGEDLDLPASPSGVAIFKGWCCLCKEQFLLSVGALGRRV